MLQNVLSVQQFHLCHLTNFKTLTPSLVSDCGTRSPERHELVSMSVETQQRLHMETRHNHSVLDLVRAGEPARKALIL